MVERDGTGAFADRAIEMFLHAAQTGPAGLIVEGDPGIGKTTLWIAAVDRARAREVTVLTSRPAQTESVLAYACLSDLLRPVDPTFWADLPQPQRHAIDRLLSRSDSDGAATDRRAVAAAFLAVVEEMARTAPLLLCIDDLQWVDPSSVHVLTFAARRTRGRVGVLGAVRTARESSAASWLQLSRPESLQRITLRPWTAIDLHALIAGRLGRAFPRPMMQKIFHTSGGNPFYALELARSIHENPGQGAESLPGSLSELVQARLADLDETTTTALLAASCLADPTVDTVAAALGTDRGALVDVLESAERQEIVTLDGVGIRFTHPLLSRGVYLRACAADRRAMHRRLADVVRQSELRARHLALAATQADATTLRALDGAAENARNRGAPEASAELIELAIRLGGDTPVRRIRLAAYHFNAGDSEQARVLLEKAIDAVPAGVLRARARYLLGVVRMFNDSFPEAIDVLRRALREVGADDALRVEVLVVLAFAETNANLGAAALSTVADAVTLAERHGMPHLLSQALGMQVTLAVHGG